jgi:hypothetical protein
VVDKCKALFYLKKPREISVYKRAKSDIWVNFLTGWLAKRMFSVIVNYNTISLVKVGDDDAGDTPMKTQVYDRFGGGLIVLIMLTIAVVAGQAQPNIDDTAATEDVFELGTEFHISIDRQRLDELEALSSVVDAVLDLPIRIEVSIESTKTPVADAGDASDIPGQ